jgi:hypothetical protein
VYTGAQINFGDLTPYLTYGTGSPAAGFRGPNMALKDEKIFDKKKRPGVLDAFCSS